MFLVLLSYLVPEERILPLRDEHYVFIDQHFRSGTFLLGGRKVPATGGFILAQGVSREELDRILGEDPYLRAGLVAHEVTELLPTRARPDLAAVIGVP
ncbi:YciI family protein [Streptosporangium sp. NPDC000239]|uniref:YciI family protein n=1 Tax=Streptosporangium jomthongense TaxID=1193683 RepID=A0ABV8FE61_9ACTN